MGLKIEPINNMWSNLDPVGPNAPIDLTGSTPLGWAAKRKRFHDNAAKKAADEQIEKELFSPGDASVLPILSNIHRSGSVRKRRTEIKQHIEANGSSATNSHSNHNNYECGLLYGFAEAGGWRPDMEDRRIAVPSILGVVRRTAEEEFNVENWSLFAVLDGHQGYFSADFVSKNLLPILHETAESMLIQCGVEVVDRDRFYTELLRKTFIKVDESLSKIDKMKFLKSKRDSCISQDMSGTTCCLCLVTPNCIIVANTGDSRAVLGVWTDTFVAVEMSHDHKPNLPDEKKRIEDAGYM